MDRDRRTLLGWAVAGAVAVSVASRAEAQERVVKVVARKFVFLPSEIPVRVGETILLELTSPDIVMGFYAPELSLRTVIIPNEVARLRFTASKAGTFPFVCDVFCGDGHEAMSGRIVVT